MKGGRDLLGFEVSGPRSGKPRFPQRRGRGGGEDKVLIAGTIGDSSFRSAACLGWGGARARPGWDGVLGARPPGGRGSPSLGGAGAPAPTSSHLMNLLPRRRVSTTVGGSSCSAWTPGLAPAMAGRGAGGPPAEPRRGPTARVLPPRAPGPPASAPRRQRPPARQSVRDGPGDRRGPGGAGRGRGHSGAAPSHRVGPPAPRRLPLAAGAATAA